MDSNCFISSDNYFILVAEILSVPAEILSIPVEIVTKLRYIEFLSFYSTRGFTLLFTNLNTYSLNLALNTYMYTDHTVFKYCMPFGKIKFPYKQL